MFSSLPISLFNVFISWSFSLIISYKDDIKHKFHEMRNKIERGDEVFKTEEWKNMKKLLETIVFAFNNEQ